jgi:CHAT domain-containing protein
MTSVKLRAYGKGVNITLSTHTSLFGVRKPFGMWKAQARNATEGRRLAWISTASKQGGNPTLAVLAERVVPTLASHCIAFESGSEIPAKFSEADLAIVAAHGGVVREGRFFQTVANDADLKVASGDLSSALAAVELVILFVCSGGRFDPYPFANSTVGLVRDLLNRGCRTVIASPWPLDARVPSHWLPEFLRYWEGGRLVNDSNFEANQAVEKAMGDSPARCLAMTVFGDPLLTGR